MISKRGSVSIRESAARHRRELPFRHAEPIPAGKALGRRHRLNPRLIKIHRNYTVDELARTLKVHKNTVRAWINQGLPRIDRKRPTIIYGQDAKRFLEDRRRRVKQPCPPGHFFCLRCRAPKIPAGAMVDYLPITLRSGNLRGICPDCEVLIHRRVSLVSIKALHPTLEVAFPQAAARIKDTTEGRLNCDFNLEGENNENA
jgi:hypothetical protein